MKYSFLILLLGSLHATHVNALTLKESFEAARGNMESIKRAEAVVDQGQALKDQARAAILPNISGVGSYTKIDPPEAAGASPFLLTRQYSAAIRLTQPLFRGGSVSAYQLAKENILLAKFQKDATEVNLYQLVINSYYNLNIAQVDLKNVEELLKYSKERVNEIRERTTIGRSRKGELVEAQAQFLTAESQYQQTLINLSQAEQTFQFYTGLKPVPIGPLNDIPKLQSPVSDFLSKVRSRPDIKAAIQETKVADQSVAIQKGGHYPAVDLTSNYYIDRTGVLATSEWDVGVAVVIPIFQGGGVEASVRQAVEARRIAELRSSEALRAAERDIIINYQNVVRLQDQLRSLKKAMAKAEEAYRLNKNDYKNGLVTNLDVLQSLNVFVETKRSYNSLVAITHLNYQNLQALIGVLP